MTTLTVSPETSGLEITALSRRAAARQQTLASAVTLRGRGLHGGDECAVTIHPAEPDTGIVFVGLSERIPAVVDNVVDTSRGTTLGVNGTRVRTVEHLMAALRGKGIDNAVVEVRGTETPALDGSALPYVEAIDSTGVVAQDRPRATLRLREPVVVRQNGSFIAAVPGIGLRITYVLNYDHPLIGAQVVTYKFSESDFGREIAPARTFVLYEEVAELLDNDLARGGSLENAIVIWRDRVSSRLRFPDELVRHKVMDLVGDLALIGCFLEAEIVAVKSGHALNVEFAKRVREVHTEAHSFGRG
ncbi:MAG: UDP-3-O-acyl-N-acetylglucosamine deacetylase [Armatimonadota bacterium]|nr:UDP-3-O-acyl-N-acetylglucosamine deacetylase [Armatimonadota bacterium]